jgi:hypothetical protein
VHQSTGFADSKSSEDLISSDEEKTTKQNVCHSLERQFLGKEMKSSSS